MHDVISAYCCLYLELEYSVVCVQLPKLPSPMSGLAVSVVGGLLYAIGGRNNGLHGNEDSSALFCYNPVCNEWAELSHMGTARNRVAAAVVDGQIYAMGGSHGVLHHASVDRYLSTPSLHCLTPTHR